VGTRASRDFSESVNATGHSLSVRNAVGSQSDTCLGIPADGWLDLFRVRSVVAWTSRAAGLPGQGAQELATKAIKKIIDPAVPLEEKTKRRRRLIKGPSEFSEDRVDMPKAKK
jgi:hypothetical protein